MKTLAAVNEDGRVWVSYDYGAHFIQTDAGLEVYKTVVVSSDGRNIAAGYDSGVQISRDSGKTFNIMYRRTMSALAASA